jgi:hypothetical protein
VRLEDVIDLEHRLLLDLELADAEKQGRDRELGRRAVPDASDAALLSEWLNGVRPRPSLGRRLRRSLTWVGLALVAIGSVAGWGAARALLSFEENGPPINVGTFLMTAVFAQIALVLLFLVFFPLSRVLPDAPVLGDVRRLLRWLSERWAGWTDATAGPLRARLRGRHSVYGRIERWVLLERTQLLGIAFNLALLLSSFRLVVTTDLAFGWSTSAAAIDAEALHRVTTALSIPWAAVVPGAVPSRQLLQRTRYSRLNARFQGAGPGSKGDPEVAAQWWPFLLMAVLVYGLVPRLGLWMVARVMVGRSLTRVPLEAPEIQAVLLRVRAQTWKSQASLRTDGTGRSASGTRDLAAPGPPSVSRSGPLRQGLLIRWRDVPLDEPKVRSRLENSFEWTIAEVRSAGHADATRDEQARDAAAGAGLVAVVAEAWEAPDKSIRRFLRRLRSAGRPELPLWVLLVADPSASPSEVTDEELRRWRKSLGTLADPYLGVERLPP